MGAFGILGDGSDGDTGWALAIEAMNSGDCGGVIHTGGVSTLNVPLPALIGPGGLGVKDNLTIAGIGPNSQFVVAADAGTMGNIFTFGDTASGDYLLHAVVKDLKIDFLNTATIDYTKAIFDVERANTLTISGLRGDGFAQIIQADLCSKIKMHDLVMTIGERGAANADQYFYFEKTVSSSFSHLDISSTWPSNTNATGAIMRFAPQAGDNIDTVHFDQVHLQSFSTNGGGVAANADGKPYGIVIDTTNSDVSATNWWFNSGVIDHCTVAGLKVLSPAGSDTRCRFLDINGMRITNDAGIPVDIDRSGTGDTTGLRIRDNVLTVGADNSPAIKVRGGNYANCSMHDNILRDRYATTAKDAAIDIDVASGWANKNNDVGNDDGDATGFVKATEYNGNEGGVFEIGMNAPGLPKPSFDPTFTLQTEGDLSVSYASRSGTYIRKGEATFVVIELTCTPTFTTGSGDIRIQGFDDNGLEYDSSDARKVPVTFYDGGWPAGQLRAETLGGRSIVIMDDTGANIEAGIEAGDIKTGVELSIEIIGEVITG